MKADQLGIKFRSTLSKESSSSISESRIADLVTKQLQDSLIQNLETRIADKVLGALETTMHTAIASALRQITVPVSRVNIEGSIVPDSNEGSRPRSRPTNEMDLDGLYDDDDEPREKGEF
ncbi:hypothetical protein JVU11DRAFT_11022 [Chiua virens]|nr:hypothetical protein JVU11DRAFT_11022 [Chiua virens]